MTLVADFQFEGANGSTTLVDSSGTGCVGTCFGAAAISTAQSWAGSSSLRMTGASGTFARIVPPSNEFVMTGDFSLSFLARPDSSSTGYLLSVGSGSLGFYGLGSVYGWSIPGLTNSDVTRVESNWHLFSMCRSGSELRMFANGFRYATYSAAGTVSFGPILNIGYWGLVNGYYWAGYMDRLQIWKDEARWNDHFDPLTEIPWTTPRTNNYRSLLGFRASTFNPDPDINPKLGVVSSAQKKLTFATSFPSRAKSQRIVILAKRMYWGGDGRIDGTVMWRSRVGDPDIPVQRKVSLIRTIDGLCIAQQWSDPVTGAYSFVGYDRDMTYTVMVWDGPRVYRAAVSDRVVPTKMTIS